MQAHDNRELHTNIGTDGNITHGDNSSGRAPRPTPPGDDDDSAKHVVSILDGLAVLAGAALQFTGAGCAVGSGLIVGGTTTVAGR